MKNHLTKILQLLKKGHLLMKKRYLQTRKHHLTLGSGTPAVLKNWVTTTGSGFKKQGLPKGIKPLAFRF